MLRRRWLVGVKGEFNNSNLLLCWLNAFRCPFGGYIVSGLHSQNVFLNQLKGELPEMNEKKEGAFEGKNAKSYDQRNDKLAPIKDNVLFLSQIIFSGLANDAHMLCVGAGTGEEVIYLAHHNPEWRFTVVEPSSAMLDICKDKIEERGVSDRCIFHEGYLDTLMGDTTYDAATCLFVAHFILDREERTDLYRQIAFRLSSGGCFFNADISGDQNSASYELTLDLWKKMRILSGANPQTMEAMMEEFERKVSIRPPVEISRMLAEAGFCDVVPIFQSLLIYGWGSTKP